LIQIDTKQAKESNIVEKILSKGISDKKVWFSWMSRMFSSIEASDKGKLTFNDIAKKDTPQTEGRCLFHLPTDFIDRVSCIHYNEEKNVVFVGARDSKFRIWKVPKEWRSKDIDYFENEMEFNRKNE
jgi:hypothetical protein